VVPVDVLTLWGTEEVEIELIPPEVDEELLVDSDGV